MRCLPHALAEQVGDFRGWYHSPAMKGKLAVHGLLLRVGLSVAQLVGSKDCWGKIYTADTVGGATMSLAVGT